MHEFKHGELKSGRGGKVKSRKQAIAIALHESGASKYDSPSKQRKNLAKSKRKESRGETYQQEKEGKARVGAKGRRESSRAMGGENATKTTRNGKSRSRSRTKSRTSTRTPSRSAAPSGTRSKTRTTSRPSTRRTAAAKRKTSRPRRAKR
jgi:hypothetical protein